MRSLQAGAGSIALVLRESMTGMSTLWVYEYCGALRTKWQPRENRAGAQGPGPRSGRQVAQRGTPSFFAADDRGMFL